ncbi:Protein strawberry notch 1 [Clonorchis sinensis]|uniref:Protein strawberry notch 1 n=1 Tax=Clonorchis sinensis TaxID=79923 RepID=A0A8T1MBJ3_CLOSI|nr:Protein strawberry notch 1 [Clonorchis sinensis]
MCVDMDPASIFEDALKGLTTKDFNDAETPKIDVKQEQSSVVDSKVPVALESHANVNVYPKRSPLVTNSPLSNSISPAPTAVATVYPEGDIILNALINAGIAPSSLSSSGSAGSSKSDSAKQLVSASTPNVKILSTKGSTVFKIVPKSHLSSELLGQQPQLRMASQLLRRSPPRNGSLASVGVPRVPNIIRKRPQPFADTLTQSPAKLLKTANSLSELDAQRLWTSDALLPAVSTAPTNLKWLEGSQVSRAPVSTRSLQPSNVPANIIKPYMLKRDDDLDEDEDLAQAETYADYVPTKLKLGSKHPDPVVESSSLSSVSPPDIHYRLLLPDEVIDRGCLSALQLEAVMYACQRHECILPNGQRAGFLIGDGAGVGKGRTIAGILYENYLRHRKKAIWLSVSNDLRVDAERDLRDVGLGRIKVHSLNKFKYARISGKANGRVKKGVIFSTYSSLIGESQGSAKAKYKTRLKQLVHWCGKKFDGLIVFDECHRAKNLTPSGSQKPTKTGLTVLELQNRLPNARIVYASATGATEPRNMAYMTRLGLWGEGTPFKTFNSFIQTLERRGVGAMELVAMDMKLRGMYIARQLSFQGVNFTIREVAIEDVRLKNHAFVHVYNQCADLWVYAYRFFSEATRLMCPGDRYRKTMWGQFWSAHQRFFKYLCIAAKIDACVELTKAAIREGKCVVIGLQSTGEAKTLEQVEELGPDLGDFVSTTKGVFQSLVEKYFPTPSNLENFSLRGEKLATAGDRSSSTTLNRAGRAVAGGQGSGLGLKDILGDKMFARLISGGSLSGSTVEDEYNGSKTGDKPSPDSDDEDDDDERSEESDDEDESEGVSALKTKDGKHHHSSSSDYYDSDLELTSSHSGTTASQRRTKKAGLQKPNKTVRRKRHEGSSSELSDNSDEDWDPDALFDSFLARQNSLVRTGADKSRKMNSNSLLDDFAGEDSMQELSQKYLLRRNSFRADDSSLQALGEETRGVSAEEAARQCGEMQSLLLRFIEKLGSKLPPSSLDELIDKLGGPSCVAEMTGRKGRMVMGDDGRVSYESRREFDVNLEILNLTEKQRFMDGEKLIAIISEAASSGISLQADRRAVNQRRRVHITLELPWSADRAIQQFGRTHRSNQVSAPKYIFLISDLAGEQRFASTVAKRLESLGALTHGDRRATDTRDLSQFNIDTKLGREALDIVLRACIHGDEGIVEPPTDYIGFEEDTTENSQNTLATNTHRFFVDVKASLQGVGLAAGRTRDKDSGQMSKFLNRILGLRVHIQNGLFRYFSDTLEELVRRAKRDNQLDLGIMDLGTSGQNLEIVWTKSFDTWFLSESTQVHLHKVTAERGLSWAQAMEIYTQHDGTHDGFYLPSNPASSKIVIPILAVYVKSRASARSSGKADTKYYRIYRPNTGMQGRLLELDKLLERYSRIPNPSDCQDAWHRVFKTSTTRCIHLMQHGFCPRVAQQRTVCEVGLRVRTYYVLSGSVLNVWAQVEPLLQGYSSLTRCMQVVRLKSSDGKRIVGSLIPQECVDDVLRCLSSPPAPVSSDGLSDLTGRMNRTAGFESTFESGPNVPHSQRAWQMAHRPYTHFPRGSHLNGRGYPPSNSQSTFRTQRQFTQPRMHSSSYRQFHRPSLLRNSLPNTIQGEHAIGPHPIHSTTLSNSHRSSSSQLPFTGVGYSLHQFPTSVTQPRAVFQEPANELATHPVRRSGSRLNAALSIPIDMAPPFTSESSVGPGYSSTEQLQLPTTAPMQPPITSISTAPQISQSTTLPLSVSEPSLADSKATVKRPVPSKMVKFKVKWKEG